MDSKLNCPYRSYADSAFWSRAVSSTPFGDLDPVIDVPFKVTRKTKVATAGSCFAQHIARYLENSGYNNFVSEQAPNFLPDALAKRYGYGVFSARYANIYTARQLLQLILRAHGELRPVEDVWFEKDSVIDPFRPMIQPDGYDNFKDYEVDRAQHFAAVRRMFADCDVFIFTLGLTEAWRHKVDGSVYPICPGCGAGAFDSEKYEFYNADYQEILADLRTALSYIRGINPGIRVILTVSPVPLVATASGIHVLPSTVYSKSVLRAVAGKIAMDDDRIGYFPSYEIIASPASRGRYFASDMRNVTEEGVRHVMRVFFRHYCDDVQGEQYTAQKPGGAWLRERSTAELAAGVFCEEESLEREGR